jgi:antitoxin ParD1/3/4
MDIQISLPDQIRTYVDEQLIAGGYSSVSEYFLHLVRQDQRRRSQEKLETLLLEGLNSEGSTEVTPEFWQQLRDSVLSGYSPKASESPETRLID